MSHRYPNSRTCRFSAWCFNVFSVDSRSKVGLGTCETCSVSSKDVALIQQVAREVLKVVRQKLQSEDLLTNSITDISQWLNIENQEGYKRKPEVCSDDQFSEDNGNCTSHYLEQTTNVTSGTVEKDTLVNNIGSERADIIEMVIIDLLRLWLLPRFALCENCRRKHFSSPEFQNESLECRSKESMYTNHSVVDSCYSLRNSWNIDGALKSLVDADKYQILTHKGSWSLNQKTLRRVIALSCCEGSLIRDRILHRCSALFTIASSVFRYIVHKSQLLQSKISTLTESRCSQSTGLPCQWSICDADAKISSSLLESCKTSTPCETGSDEQPQFCFTPSMRLAMETNQYHCQSPEDPSRESRDMHPFVLRAMAMNDSLFPLSCKVVNISDEVLLLVFDHVFHAMRIKLSGGIFPLTEAERDVPQLSPTSEVSGTFQLGREAILSEQDKPIQRCPLPDLFRSALNITSGDDSIIVLVSGASGCGKSTLSCLLANRLGLGTVLSTDTIRHILRSICSKSENPLLYASTYETGKYITTEELLKSNRTHPLDAAMIGKLVRTQDDCKETNRCSDELSKIMVHCPEEDESLASAMVERRRCVEGYLQQSEMLYDRLEFIISELIGNGESLVVEGVHLTNDFIQRIQSRFPNRVISFLVYLSNEDTHVDRFASRSKNFNIEPAKNKYVEYLENIRTIQQYLKKQVENDSVLKRFDLHDYSTDQCDVHMRYPVTLVDNTSISTAIRLMHSTVVQFLGSRRPNRSNGGCCCSSGCQQERDDTSHSDTVMIMMSPSSSLAPITPASSTEAVASTQH